MYYCKCTVQSSAAQCVKRVAEEKNVNGSGSVREASLVIRGAAWEHTFAARHTVCARNGGGRRSLLLAVSSATRVMRRSGSRRHESVWEAAVDCRVSVGIRDPTAHSLMDVVRCRPPVWTAGHRLLIKFIPVAHVMSDNRWSNKQIYMSINNEILYNVLYCSAVVGTRVPVPIIDLCASDAILQ